MELHINSTKYSHQAALVMAACSKAVYETDGERNLPCKKSMRAVFKDVVGKSCKVIQTYQCNNTQAALVEYQGHLIATFRGTDEALDWVTNLNVYSKSFIWGKVHGGFYNALWDVWGAMKEKIETIQQKARDKGEHMPLWFTGHSLGGAIATLAAADRMYSDKPFHGVYTYGQPRCVDGAFAEVFDSKINKYHPRFFRFQNDRDLVSRIPMRVMEYSHVGCCFYMDSDGEIHEDPAYWFMFLDRVGDAVEKIADLEYRVELLTDHAIDNYISNIKAAIAR